MSENLKNVEYEFCAQNCMPNKPSRFILTFSNNESVDEVNIKTINRVIFGLNNF